MEGLHACAGGHLDIVRQLVDQVYHICTEDDINMMKSLSRQSLYL